jgi:steroid 5-alpha reductase family enzyme
MNPLSILLVALGLSLVMAAAWWWQKRVVNIGWVDVFWTFGVAAAGVVLAFAPGGEPGSLARRLIVSAIVLVWSLRLGLYVAFRVARSPEDGRYLEIRRDWGKALQGRMFWFLQLQALVSLVLAIAIGLAARRPDPELGAADALGVAIALVAILGETVADRQMKAFRQDPNNQRRVCEVGLWAWSRHPNYFFEWLGWFAFPLMAIGLTDGHPLAWFALGAPAVMFLVLRFGTGVPPLEAHMLRSRGDLFRDYQARVSAFIPLPPKTRGA